jgi:hypothetical protein
MKAWKKQKRFQKLEFPKAVQNPKRCNGSKTQKKTNAMKRSLCKRKICFGTAQNKCLQESLLTLARATSPNVYAVLLRMFTASCANGSASGSGSGSESAANLYATEHALRYIGAYALVHVSSREGETSNDCIHCWKLGSGNGYCIGHIEWDFEAHHAQPAIKGASHTTYRLASSNQFRPWEQGYVGASIHRSQ